MFLEETTFSTKQSAPVKVLCDAMAFGGTTWSKTFHCPEGPWSPSWSWSLATFQHRARHKRMARIGSLMIMTCGSQHMMIIMCNSQWWSTCATLNMKGPSMMTKCVVHNVKDLSLPRDHWTHWQPNTQGRSQFTKLLKWVHMFLAVISINPNHQRSLFHIFKDTCATSPTLNQTSFHVYQIYFTRNVHYRQRWLGHTPCSISK